MQRIIRRRSRSGRAPSLDARGHRHPVAADRSRIHWPRRACRGDLDWITLKALEKDRGRRYGTAAELAADIERHLRHEPVSASPPDAFLPPPEARSAAPRRVHRGGGGFHRVGGRPRGHDHPGPARDTERRSRGEPAEAGRPRGPHRGRATRLRVEPAFPRGSHQRLEHLRSFRRGPFGQSVYGG